MHLVRDIFYALHTKETIIKGFHFNSSGPFFFFIHQNGKVEGVVCFILGGLLFKEKARALAPPVHTSSSNNLTVILLDNSSAAISKTNLRTKNETVPEV